VQLFLYPNYQFTQIGSGFEDISEILVQHNHFLPLLSPIIAFCSYMKWFCQI